MQEGGAIYSKMPSVLADKICNVEKKYNVKANAGTNGGQLARSNDSLFILSMTENARNCAKYRGYWNDSSYQGSTYKFWDNAGVELGDQKKDSYQYKLVISLNSTRSGILMLYPGSGNNGYCATRSLANNRSQNILHICILNGHVDSNDGGTINYVNNIVPAFAF